MDGDAVRVVVVERDLVPELLMAERLVRGNAAFDPRHEIGQANVLADLDGEPWIALYGGESVERNAHLDCLAHRVGGRDRGSPQHGRPRPMSVW